MTTPRVIEMPRRLEPISADTFLGGCASDVPPSAAPAAPPVCESRPLAAVVQLRPRDPLAARRSARNRRVRHAPRPGTYTGPGDDAA
jgi:hypothetical protein